jgi:hypothetical protein
MGYFTTRLVLLVAEAQVSDGEHDPLRDERVFAVGRRAVEQQLHPLNVTDLQWKRVSVIILQIFLGEKIGTFDSRYSHLCRTR